MRVSIIGSGYVGLVSGAGLSQVGHHVVCMDIDEGRIADLNQGIVPIYEPGLDDMLAENAEQGRLSFTTSIEEAVDDTLGLIAEGVTTSDAVRQVAEQRGVSRRRLYELVLRAKP